MQIVIDIPEEDYEIMKHNVVVGNPLCPIGQEEMVNKVVNGTPLPKGHGRLIDADRLECDYFNRIYDDYAFDCIDNAPTIIKADISGMFKQ